jgi:hypothetical protein
LVPPLQHIIDTYHCCFGPSDNSQNVARAASLAAAGRRKGTERGNSIKRGCRASFRVVQPHNSDLAQIRVPEDGWNALLEHTNEAGHICHGPGCPEAGKFPLLSW